MKNLAVIAVVAAVLLSACTSGDDPADTTSQATPSPTATTTPKAFGTPEGGGDSFASAKALLAAMRKGGAACVDYEPIPPPQAGMDLGRCFTDASHDVPLDLWVFDSSSLRNRWLAGIRRAGGIELIYAGNWFVASKNERVLRQVNEVLDGRMLS